MTYRIDQYFLIEIFVTAILESITNLGHPEFLLDPDNCLNHPYDLTLSLSHDKFEWYLLEINLESYGSKPMFSGIFSIEFIEHFILDDVTVVIS